MTGSSTAGSGSGRPSSDTERDAPKTNAAAKIEIVLSKRAFSQLRRGHLGSVDGEAMKRSDTEKRCPNASDTFHTSRLCEPLHDDRERDHRDMREIFEPSSVRLYIRPFGSRMKPTTGLVTLLESTDPPTPTVMIATDPSTPIFQPDVRRN